MYRPDDSPALTDSPRIVRLQLFAATQLLPNFMPLFGWSLAMDKSAIFAILSVETWHRPCLPLLASGR
jgi:hypothetical protein